MSSHSMHCRCVFTPAQSRIRNLFDRNACDIHCLRYASQQRRQKHERRAVGQRQEALGNISAGFKHQHLSLTKQTANLKTAQGWLDKGLQ